jgi:hypothetical protein
MPSSSFTILSDLLIPIMVVEYVDVSKQVTCFTLREPVHANVNDSKRILETNTCIPSCFVLGGLRVTFVILFQRHFKTRTIFQCICIFVANYFIKYFHAIKL